MLTAAAGRYHDNSKASLLHQKDRVVMRHSSDHISRPRSADFCKSPISFSPRNKQKERPARVKSYVQHVHHVGVCELAQLAYRASVPIRHSTGGTVISFIWRADSTMVASDQRKGSHGFSPANMRGNRFSISVGRSHNRLSARIEKVFPFKRIAEPRPFNVRARFQC